MLLRDNSTRPSRSPGRARRQRVCSQRARCGVGREEREGQRGHGLPAQACGAAAAAAAAAAVILCVCVCVCLCHARAVCCAPAPREGICSTPAVVLAAARGCSRPCTARRTRCAHLVLNHWTQSTQRSAQRTHRTYPAHTRPPTFGHGLVQSETPAAALAEAAAYVHACSVADYAAPLR
jgi:hypothetical protein